MKLKTFKTLQYNITHILHINSSTIIFCVIHNFTFLMIDTKIKEQVSFESWEKKKLLVAQFSVKCIVLPAQSIMLANWFVCIPAWTSRDEQDRAGLNDKPVQTACLSKLLQWTYWWTGPWSVAKVCKSDMWL